MKTENWSGLVTNASPYALPPGAATEQVNFHNAIPGQLTARGGMRIVAHSDTRFSSNDVCSIHINGATHLIALGNGGLHALSSPAIGSATSIPIVPDPTSDGGIVGTTYLWQYEGLGYSSVDPVRDTTPWIDVLNGGTSSTEEYPFAMNANAACGKYNELLAVYGGTSGTNTFPQMARESRLCEAQ